MKMGFKMGIVLAACAVIMVLSGCQSNSGSREYIPGRGWTPTR